MYYNKHYKRLGVFVRCFMKNVLIVGGGLAGCTAAKQLSKFGIPSILLESSSIIGGKVRDYGCKADSRCSQCGVCLAGNLWEAVENDPNISIYYNARIFDLYKNGDGFTACFLSGPETHELNVTDVIVASGFTDYAERSLGAAEIAPSRRILTGRNLETLLKGRTSDSIFEHEPASVAFIMCFGSRDIKEKAQYCSRVCCGYATRSAKVLRHYYPNAEITLFYMDLQTVNSSPRYMDELRKNGIRFERCRPARIGSEESLPVVTYENSEGLQKKTFDYVILCGAVHPCPDAAFLSDITGLRVDENGFLQYVLPPEMTHVYLAGCASGPKSIYETSADAAGVAARIANFNFGDGVRQ